MDYSFFKSMHGYIALLACFLLVLLTLLTVMYFINKKELPTMFRKIGLYTLISFHLQLILGILLLFIHPTIAKNFTDFKIQNMMSLMEHIPANLTVILLVTIFYSKLKRSDSISGVMLALIILALLLLGRTFMLLNGVLQ